jgi:hypothetical protein
MKNWFWLLVVISFSSFASYGQNVNVYQHFSELKGMEDYNGNTNLLYRINSITYNANDYSDDNSIHLLNLNGLSDSVFLSAGGYYYDQIGGGGRSVNDYKFWNNDPTKYIICGSMWGMDPVGFIDRYDGYHYSYAFEYSFLGISKQNDNLLYCSADNNTLLKSTNKGNNWDTVSNFNAISLSPFNDKTLFIYSGQLYKSTDGGLTKSLVDSTASFQGTDVLTYDKDSNYIYRVAGFNDQGHPVYKLLISNNSGNAYSWQVKLTSTIPIYLSNDPTVAGSVYMALGKNVYQSTDFGNSFSLLKPFERKLVGIYKKPGSSKLFTATYNTLYEIDGATVNIIKQIPIDKEIFKYDPLEVGNKWVYNAVLSPLDGESIYSVASREIIKDTILADNQSYKQIVSKGYPELYDLSQYERFDSTTGKVYTWRENKAEVLYDLSLTQGDTINSYMGFFTFDSLTTKNIFGIQRENHYYNPTILMPGFHAYSLTKDFGLFFYLSNFMEDTYTFTLKGAIIKGVVYGDTSFTAVGVNDKVPSQPKAFALYQNYPNPFNPSTTIKYSLPKAGNVKLTVYNAIGGKVATILNEYKTAGNYSVEFNGSNLASGIYLYRLESGNYIAAKKFVLLK